LRSLVIVFWCPFPLHNRHNHPQVVVLSDRFAGPDRLPIPSLLATGAVHQHLLQTQQRPKSALFTEAGDAREVRRMRHELEYNRISTDSSRLAVQEGVSVRLAGNVLSCRYIQGCQTSFFPSQKNT